MRMPGGWGARAGIAGVAAVALTTVSGSGMATSPAAADNSLLSGTGSLLSGSGSLLSGTGSLLSGDDAVVTVDWGDISKQEEKQTLDHKVWNPTRDPGSMYSLTAGYGIQGAWANGATGHDVTVAVIDTGVAPVEGLTFEDDKLMNGPDLSFEGQTSGTRYVDGF